MTYAKCYSPSLQVGYGGYSSALMDYSITLNEGSFNQSSLQSKVTGTVSVYESYKYPIFESKDHAVDGIIIITPKGDSTVKFNIPFHYTGGRTCKFSVNSGIFYQGKYQTIVNFNMKIDTGLRHP